MKRTCLLACACVAALTVGCNGHNRTDNTIANTTDVVGTAGRGVSTGDTNFVNDMLSANTAEVETAKLAGDHAASREVKQFAQMMVDDHTKAGDQLKQIATAKAVPQDQKTDDAHRDLMDKLSKLHGADFDKAFMNAMVDDHEKAVRSLRSRVDEDRSLKDRLEGRNPENPAAVKPELSDDRVRMSVNQWAADMLPTVEHHLDRAKEIEHHIDHPNATARIDTGTPERPARY